MSPGLTKVPLPGLRDLLAPPAPIRTPFRPGYRTAYTMNGRNAIHLGLSALGIRPGAVVLLPAFHCTALVDPVMAYGARPAYYPVRRDLTLDLASIEAALVRTGASALLCVHFFGWPAPVRELRALCDRHGASLIEDATHGLFGEVEGRPYGCFGDVAVFSFRKTLPVQDGGALVVRAARAAFPRPRRFFPAPYQLRMLKWTLDASRAGPFRPQPVSPAARASEPPPPGADRARTRGSGARSPAGIRGPDSQEDPAFVPECLLFPMSLASRLILGSASAGAVVAARRRNYAFLSRRLAGVAGLEPCFRDLPEGVCPMGFPCLAGDGGPRWDYRLRGHGVPAFSFGEELHATLDLSGFPDARELSERLVILPVHQGLSEADLERMAALVIGAFGAAG
ncbi:MAG TPA: DegT/DnrJ/EryC1/StrS family aminotransferase [Fibrobacteria bacterium]|nr:DegT/DnrJ/EryC1/StrS family aminotransferase [Fibrobacteria bacterium]